MARTKKIHNYIMETKATQYLYKDFLSNNQVYHLNIGYWKRQVNKITKKTGIEDIKPWHSGRYMNGKLRYDGNPIYSGYIQNTNKAFRIIQEEPESEVVEIGAWVEQKERNDIIAPELTISLELSSESQAIAYQLLHKWLTENASVECFSEYIGETLRNEMGIE